MAPPNASWPDVQTVRLIDVFVLGPAMMLVGTRGSAAPRALRLGVAAAGLLTIGYNLERYLSARNRG